MHTRMRVLMDRGFDDTSLEPRRRIVGTQTTRRSKARHATIRAHPAWHSRREAPTDKLNQARLLGQRIETACLEVGNNGRDEVHRVRSLGQR